MKYFALGILFVIAFMTLVVAFFIVKKILFLALIALVVAILVYVGYRFCKWIDKFSL